MPSPESKLSRALAELFPDQPVEIVGTNDLGTHVQVGILAPRTVRVFPSGRPAQTTDGVGGGGEGNHSSATQPDSGVSATPDQA